MTNYLRLIAMIEVIVYLIYLFLFIFGQLNLPNGIAFVSFLIITFSFITSEVILASIIEVRDVVFNRYQDLQETLQNKSKPSRLSDMTSQGTTNILEKGGTLIEQNSITKKWTCSCGFNNTTSSKECLSCTKPRMDSSR